MATHYRLNLTTLEYNRLFALLKEQGSEYASILAKVESASPMRPSKKKAPAYAEVEIVVGLSHCGRLVTWTMEPAPGGWRVVGHCPHCNTQVYTSKRIVTITRAQATINMINRLNQSLGLDWSLTDGT